MWSKMLMLSIVVGVCIAATMTTLDRQATQTGSISAKQAIASEILKTSESNSRQFGGGYGGYGHYPGGFGGYGGYGGSWGGHGHQGGGGYGGYGHGGYPHGGGYGHGHHHG